MLRETIALANGAIEKALDSGISEPRVRIEQLKVRSGENIRDEINSTLYGFGSLEEIDWLKEAFSPEENEQIQVDLQFGPREGSGCPPLLVIDLHGMPIERTFPARDPRLYVVLFWSSYSYASHKALSHLQDLIEANQQWKIEVLAISVDKDQARAQEFAMQQSWRTMKLAWVGPGGLAAALSTRYQIKGIPTMLFIKKGQVMWRGHPNDIDMEREIVSLVANAARRKLTIEIDIGDSCPPLPVLDLVSGDERILEWDKEDATIYIVDCLEIWFAPSHAKLRHYQEIMERNEHWVGKVKILVIVMDNEREQALKYTTSQNFSHLEFFWTKKGDFTTRSMMKLQSMRTCILLHKGKILWVGPFGSRDTEGYIDILTQGGEFMDVFRQTQLDKSHVDSSLDQINQAIKDMGVNNPHLRILPKLVFYNEAIVRPGMDVWEKYRAHFIGKFHEKYRDQVEAIWQIITEQLPFTSHSIVYNPGQPPIVRLEQCNLCQTALTEDVNQYRCLYCQHAHCQTCEDQERPGSGSHSLAHHHYTYLIHPKAQELASTVNGPTSIDENQFLEETPNLRHTGVLCDNDLNTTEYGCDGHIEGVRWSCAHCDNFDFCGRCEKWWRDGVQSVKENAEKAGHMEWHVMFKMPFPGDLLGQIVW